MVTRLPHAECGRLAQRPAAGGHSRARRAVGGTPVSSDTSYPWAVGVHAVFVNLLRVHLQVELDLFDTLLEISCYRGKKIDCHVSLGSVIMKATAVKLS